MKKSIMALGALLYSTLLFGQSEFDALKYVQPDINGTAKYTSMAGAFGALGGDASAIKDNPAGLGIYNKSEVTGTLNLLFQQTSADWNGVNNKENLINLGANNISIVLAKKTKAGESGTKGLLNSNFSISYNILKSFDRSLNVKNAVNGSESSMTDYIANFTGSISPEDLSKTNSYDPYISANIPWISVQAYDAGLIARNPFTGTWASTLSGIPETVTPSFVLTEKGFVDEYSIGWAGNLSNFIYLGATANVQSINYTSYSTYNEIFGDGGFMAMIDTISTKGNGVNLNIGTIIKPLKFLSLGFSAQTPTLFILKDNYNSKLNYETPVDTGIFATPGSRSNYQLKSPLQLTASAAFILEKLAVVSFEYDYSNITGMLLMNKNGDQQDYATQNLNMKSNLANMQTIKIGGEFNINDNYSVRAGYANSSNPTITGSTKILPSNSTRTDSEYFLHKSTNYLTAGLGYQKNNWFADVAFKYSTYNETFSPYSPNGVTLAQNEKPATLSTTNTNLVISLGYKF